MYYGEMGLCVVRVTVVYPRGFTDRVVRWVGLVGQLTSTHRFKAQVPSVRRACADGLVASGCIAFAVWMGGRVVSVATCAVLRCTLSGLVRSPMCDSASVAREDTRRRSRVDLLTPSFLETMKPAAHPSAASVAASSSSRTLFKLTSCTS